MNLTILAERIAWLRHDPAFQTWWKALLPCRAYRDACEIRPLNEGLQHWEATVFTTIGGVIPIPPTPFGKIATQRRRIVTPPAKPEWLNTTIPGAGTGSPTGNPTHTHKENQ